MGLLPDGGLALPLPRGVLSPLLMYLSPVSGLPCMFLSSISPGNLGKVAGSGFDRGKTVIIRKKEKLPELSILLTILYGQFLLHLPSSKPVATWDQFISRWPVDDWNSFS